ncbi:MAG: hypothetical protein ABI824_05590 [Acidobacteriota bacterium]
MVKLSSTLFNTVLGLAALTVTLLAQSKSGILQPQMTVAEGKGTYKQPLGALGEKSATPWSATTLGASVDGKPNTGATKTVVGEIIDFSCYLEIGKHGGKHVDCAQKCFRAGQPIGLLTADGSLYMLMEEEHDPRRDGMGIFRDAAIEHAGHIMQVSGTVTTVRGINALYVRGFMKK